MKIEIDLPACSHSEQLKKLRELRDKLIEITAWAGWLDNRWALEILFWIYPDYPSSNGQRNYSNTFSGENGARDICLKLATVDLGFKKFEEVEILYQKTKKFRDNLGVKRDANRAFRIIGLKKGEIK